MTRIKLFIYNLYCELINPLFFFHMLKYLYKNILLNKKNTLNLVYGTHLLIFINQILNKIKYFILKSFQFYIKKVILNPLWSEWRVSYHEKVIWVYIVQERIIEINPKCLHMATLGIHWVFSLIKKIEKLWINFHL